MDQDFSHPRLRGGSSSQTAARLEKLDFWMRNLDYLADELLTDHLEGRLPRQAIEVHVSRMLSVAPWAAA